MLPLGTWIYTKFFGTCVGEDIYGNRYFQSSRTRGQHIGKPGTQRRWVRYKGRPEPSKIPPAWHSWMHYITDEIPSQTTESAQYAWEKPHLPNLTGTTLAYLPSGHKKAGGKRAKTTADYQAWKP